MLETKTLVGLRVCTGSPEPLLGADAIRTKILCTGLLSLDNLMSCFRVKNLVEIYVENRPDSNLDFSTKSKLERTHYRYR